MKKKLVTMWVLLLLAMLLWGCSAPSTIHTVEENGMEYVVDTQACTITVGGSTYRYTLTGDRDKYQLTITYPNGISYYYAQSGGQGTISWDDGYDPGTYDSGNALVGVLKPLVLKESRDFPIEKLLVVILGVGAGAFFIARPEIVWFLSRGWYYRDAEPSDWALAAYRISGAGIIMLALLMCLL